MAPGSSEDLFWRPPPASNSPLWHAPPDATSINYFKTSLLGFPCAPGALYDNTNPHHKVKCCDAGEVCPNRAVVSRLRTHSGPARVRYK